MAESTFGKGYHLHLIDGSAFIFRAYHALPPADAQIRRPARGRCRGVLQHAVESCSRRTAARTAATHIAVVFDNSAHTFRNDLYPTTRPTARSCPKTCARSSR